MIYPTWKRIFISVDMDYKNHARLNSEDISLIRDRDNFDKKYVRPINGIVISSEKIPKGAEVLIHHNATHDTYRIYDYEGLNGEYIGSNIRHFSIPESECYAWRVDNGEWNPCEGFEFGLRIYKPYEGFLSMLPTQIKNKLYITTGGLKGKVVMTKGASDYEMTYQDNNGREGKLIRVRHFNKPANIREEIVAICNDTTAQVNEGLMLVGLSVYDCKINTFHVEDYANQ